MTDKPTPLDWDGTNRDRLKRGVEQYLSPDPEEVIEELSLTRNKALVALVEVQKETNEHLWWVSLSIKIALGIMVIGIFLTLFAF